MFVHAKIGRIPRGFEHYAKRDGEESSDGGEGETSKTTRPNSTTPTPTPTKGGNNSSNTSSATSTKPTSQGTSAKPTNSSKGSSSGGEQGPLESDKPEHSTSQTHTSTGTGTSAGEKPSGVDTDAEGNPIVTNPNASYWNMITPTGVSYLSGGWRAVPGTGMVVVVAAVVGALI
ncbi:hypothetical protein GGI20_004919 [Coemansia sp. BCRC 34301]|nr:hypothetical protein GGI20_004919 [Coemansia sp. BCRC 34301]